MEKQKILVVDDEEDNVNLLEKRLKPLGYEVLTAFDGEEALDKAFSQLPDLILLDIMMPKKDGFEVLEILRKNEKTKYLPVILLTAKTEVSDKVRGFETGAIDYVTKPFDFNELKARVLANLKSQKKVEEKIKAEKLVALSTMMEGVAHEIRNPLTIIGGFANRLLSMIDKDDPKYFFVNEISKEVRRLEKMIKDIYEFKTMTITKTEEYSVNKTVKDAISELKEKISQKNIIVLESYDENDVKILMDRGHFVKAIVNIIDNAIDAISTRGIIDISTKKEEKSFVINIKDNGVGIKTDDLKYIFDPFFTSKMEGTGLGLPVALKIIKEHKGNISVESKKDQGTVISIEIELV